MKSQWKSQLLLLLATMFWGLAFVTQTTAMDFVGPFTFQAARQFLGFLVLQPVIALRTKSEPAALRTPQAKKRLILCGALCGFALFAACSLQQFGIYMGVTAGKSGFITALYIIFVPLFGIFFRRRVAPQVWISVLIAVVGLYLLCGGGAFTFGLGELLTLLCAFAFSGHILLIDRIGSTVDSVRLSALQFLFCALYSLPCALLTEKVSLTAVLNAWLPIVYTGIFSSGVAYTLQIIAQKNCEPAIASLTMSTESVFATLFGWLLIGQHLTKAEILGCIFMFCAIVLAQFPTEKLRRKNT